MMRNFRVRHLRERYIRQESGTLAPYLLKGAKPADLPIEQLTRFELLNNLQTAKVPGLKVPQSVLIRTDEVIQ